MSRGHRTAGIEDRIGHNLAGLLGHRGGGQPLDFSVIVIVFVALIRLRYNFFIIK